MAAELLQYNDSNTKMHYAALPRTRVFITLFVVLLVSGSITLARAESLPAVIGSMIPIENVTDFKAQPLALLAKFPEAGNAMASYVARVFTRETSMVSLVDSILSIADDASPQQASAIGAGLVRGVRAIEGKQPNTARIIADKIKNSTNLWLKTTFTALGPHYSPTTAMLPAMLPPAPLSTKEVGEEMPTQGQLGPTERNGCHSATDRGQRLRTRQLDPRRDRTNPLEQQDCEQENPPNNREAKVQGFYYGTIVAMLASDAPSNGAVSTSPTQ